MTQGSSQPIQSGLQAANQPSPALMLAGGLVPSRSNAQIQAEEKRKAELVNTKPLLQGLAAHVRKRWEAAYQAKQQEVETRMLAAVRARRGEYDPEKLAEIRKTGGSEIYMMLTSVKCRSALAWLKDVLLGDGENKPWEIEASPIPSLSPDHQAMLKQVIQGQLMEIVAAGGQVDPEFVPEFAQVAEAIYLNKLREEAEEKAELMERKMETQLIEGRWLKSFADFLDDLTTFPAAILKGPVVRNKPQLKWVQTQNGFDVQVQDDLVLEWDRVDPFMVYPSPQASGVDDGAFIERHRLRRSQLNDLIGVEGYSDAAIRGALDDYGRGGLHEWIAVDTLKADAEGKIPTNASVNSDELIDALQCWDSVQGKMLIEWGMDEGLIDDPMKDYECEIWLIGSWVIKAALNPDPLKRRPYFKACWEEIPGVFWGNSVADLCADSQTMCNASARALANNMGIASGPQIAALVDRLPNGEEITQMYPWKIWQFNSDAVGGSAKPIDFFMPESNASELMSIFEKFSELADEWTGIPRYMVGQAHVGGAGRTASGMSMMIGNAGKSIKQVVSNLDINVIAPSIRRLYYYNMRYGDDPVLKGDVHINAKGAMAIIAKEQAQVRRNEFLAATANPIDAQIIGMDGRAAILREIAKTLNMNPDDVVPSIEVIKAKERAQQRVQAQQQQIAQEAQQQLANAEQNGPDMGIPSSGQFLTNGAPVTDHFSPPSQG